MIPKVTGTEEETALAVTAPMISVFTSSVSLPEIRHQGTPSVIASSSSIAQSHPMVMPRTPISTQFGMGNATLKGVCGANGCHDACSSS